MKLYPHQEKLLTTLTENDTFGIFFECRVGKTLPTLLHITNLMLSGKAKNCLVIAPISALGAWKRDIETFTGKRREVANTIDLINYESVWRKPKYNTTYDIIVCDESHRIAHRTSKQTKFIHKLAKSSKYRYILSGTPIGQGRMEDMYSQMEFLEKGFFGSWKNFVDNYCIVKRMKGTYVDIIVAYKHKDELIAKISSKVASLRLADVAKDLPEDLPDNLVIHAKPNQKINRGVKDNYVAEYDLLIPNPAVRMMKFRQVASGFIIDEQGKTHEVTNGKVKAFNELIDSILPERIVVFAEFKHSIKTIMRELDKRGLNYLVLDGTQADKECWRRFQSNDNITVMVCQYKSANAGIDLWKAHHTIFFEPSVSTTMTEQAKARTRCVGMKQPRAYHWLLAESSIEKEIYKSLVNKQDFTLDIMSQWVIR